MGGWPMVKKPNSINVHVGKQVRLLRILLGMNQTALGAAIGLTFQQIQKYEDGTNRIAASRLYELAKVLGVSIGSFFEEIPPEFSEGQSADFPRSDADFPTKRETLQVVRYYNRIQDAAARRLTLDLIREIADQDEG